MLRPEQVRARRRGELLELLPLAPALRQRALDIAGAAIAVAKDHAGEPREMLERAWAAIEAKPNERRLADGLVKLVDDACEFETPEGLEPAMLRSELFLRAAALRQNLPVGERLERGAVLEATARALDVAPERLEQDLYGDLRSAQRLFRVEPVSAEALVLRYERAQVQAVLLRAVRVCADVSCATAEAYRALFHKLKFRQLLHRITPRDGGGYRIEIDGPMSLFEATTKYGLELAMMVPPLLECDAVDVSADLHWGKRRDRLKFQFRHRRSNPGLTAARTTLDASDLRSEAREVLDAVNQLGGAFRAEVASEIVELPGLGLCVPDLSFLHVPTGQRVGCEILGFWSRDAVFRRVELAARGLPRKLLFVVSSRLRVSEELLDGIDNSALYVFKGRINVRTLLNRLEALL